jgi:hypothetical protein
LLNVGRKDVILVPLPALVMVRSCQGGARRTAIAAKMAQAMGTIITGLPGFSLPREYHLVSLLQSTEVAATHYQGQVEGSISRRFPCLLLAAYDATATCLLDLVTSSTTVRKLVQLAR